MSRRLSSSVPNRPSNRPTRSPTPPAQLSIKPPKPKVKWTRVAGAIALIVLLSGGIVGCGWLALQLIVNPQSSFWVNQWFPGWVSSKGSEHPPKTLY
ncbi:MAG: hypothetical protein LH647_05280, partial [Leptolyngbyaceae cyanobacterium CAN_BIN12]|nr:hypothetical protein [Leptolyngbyaceae cyanobacterium CAN_BIN12]